MLSITHHFSAIRCIFQLLAVSICCYSSRSLHSYTHTSNNKNVGSSIKKKEKKSKGASRANVPYGIPSSGLPATCISTPWATTASSSVGLLLVKSPANPSAERVDSTDTVSMCASCHRGKASMCPGVSNVLYDGAPDGQSAAWRTAGEIHSSRDIEECGGAQALSLALLRLPAEDEGSASLRTWFAKGRPGRPTARTAHL